MWFVQSPIISYDGAIENIFDESIMEVLFVAKEQRDFEDRVALIPKDVENLQKTHRVLVESGAGQKSGYSDSEYQSCKAQIVSLDEGLEKAHTIVFVQGPQSIKSWKLKPEQLVIGLLNTFAQSDWLDYFCAQQCSSLALELIPRITRAQSMDILSSQSNLAGYKAVLLAVEQFNGVVPMLMTAAGSISPAKFLILGAGVAGLQAIATAKRLGGQVSAFDVRPAAKEQVESLGARFIEVDTGEDLETSGGYAKETSDDYKQRQQELLNQELQKVDIVITTALIPGRQAPTLLSSEQVQMMKPGSIVVDMAVAMGGNCALSKYGENIVHNQVTVIGHPNLASLVAKDSSKFFSKNIFNLLKHLHDTGAEQWGSDPIAKDCLIQVKGQYVHDNYVSKTQQAAAI